MSHNVQITGIKINNLDALDKACAELCREGVNVSLERGKGTRSLKFRTYMGASAHNDPTADHVIRLPEAMYDIGLVKQPGGHYQPVYDDMLGTSLPSPIACPYKAGEATNRGHALGKLMQRYTAIVTETEGRRRGFLTRRVTTKDGGLEIVMRR